MGECEGGGLAEFGGGGGGHQVALLAPLLGALVCIDAYSCRLRVTVGIPGFDLDIPGVRAVERSCATRRLKCAAGRSHRVLFHFPSDLDGHFLSAVPSAVCGGAGGEHQVALRCGEYERLRPVKRAGRFDLLDTGAAERKHRSCGEQVVEEKVKKVTSHTVVVTVIRMLSLLRGLSTLPPVRGRPLLQDGLSGSRAAADGRPVGNFGRDGQAGLFDRDLVFVYFLPFESLVAVVKLVDI